ncbi:MrcB family domain-containing protein [Clostridium beijerinckii]|nr:DUF3578 domain-containing protein [Clostridium beijerinckii]MZK69289.1 DUF3578 domain-containing protein [Clostridium beijerinckii]MZK74662.1 DUF3578 domain-containing protein [Clostridium beijerinckii]MZL18593.1 DUF3578 domain-containing protein [Clostridium beijerinckii]
MNEILKSIMKEYLNKKITEPFNKESSMFQLLNYTSKDAIKKAIDNLHLSTVNLEVKASCGAGGWTRYPWIAVFNPDVTTTIQEGIYIVYLFSEDMKRLYLTLNQGCTNLNKRLGRREALNKMKSTREEFRNKYPSDLFKIDNDLKVGNDDYEEGCIYYEEYSIDDFPSEDKIIEDLSNLISIYNEYYNKEINGDVVYNVPGEGEMENERSDSWSKIQTENKNAIARKTVDYSTFEYGSVIPTRYHKAFIDHLSKELTKGSKVDITIIIDTRKYNGSINFPNLKRNNDVIRLSFNKKLKEFLSKELSTSYQYIMKVKDQGTKNSIIKLPDEFKECIDFYKGEEKDTFIVKLIKRDEDAITDGDDENFDDNDIEDIEETSNETEIIKDFEVRKAVDYIHNFIESQGYTYDKSLIKNLYISLKTKPFVILSGISGTGKSKIVELFAKSLGATAENKRFNLVPVKPDWSDSTDLLGFRNIEGKFTPGIITKICYEAMMNPELSYFICLDEMNLAGVEYYFSDILSLMETRRLNEDNEIITNTLLSEEQIGRDSVSISTYGDVYIPQNLYIIGTVNMDETTFPFSKKVLDRANTIEFNKVDLSYSFEDNYSSFDDSNNNDEIKIYHNDFLKSEFLKIRDCKEYKDTAQKAINELIKINSILEKYNYHFGYRVRDEITFYMIYAVKDNLMSFDESFDLCVVQKILPKISGSSKEVLDMLLDIFELFNNYRFSNREYLEEKELKDLKEKVTDLNEGSDKINYKFKLTNEKLIYMIRRFIRDGFTTFWQ